MPRPSTVCKALHAVVFDHNTMREPALEREVHRLSSKWDDLGLKDVTTDPWTRTPAPHCAAVMTYVMHITLEMPLKTHNLQVQWLQSSEHNNAEHSTTIKAGKHLCEQWHVTTTDVLLTMRTHIISLHTYTDHKSLSKQPICQQDQFLMRMWQKETKERVKVSWFTDYTFFFLQNAHRQSQSTRPFLHSTPALGWLQSINKTSSKNSNTRCSDQQNSITTCTMQGTHGCRWWLLVSDCVACRTLSSLLLFGDTKMEFYLKEQKIWLSKIHRHFSMDHVIHRVTSHFTSFHSTE